MCAKTWGCPLLRKPITGIAGCCARAASGHAAAPPSRVMNWRLFRSGMGFSPEPAVPAYRRLRMHRKRPQGADLKCSESGMWTAAASCRAQQAPGPKVALRRKLLFLDKRTLAFAQGLGRLFSRNAPENLVIVPFCLGFARRLNFDGILFLRHAAVPAHSPFGEEIVDRQLPYLICDRPSIYRPRCLHRLEIVQHR